MAKYSETEKQKWLDMMAAGRSPREISKNEVGAPNWNLLYNWKAKEENKTREIVSKRPDLNIEKPKLQVEDVFSPGERAIFNSWIKNVANRTKLFLLISQSLDEYNK